MDDFTPYGDDFDQALQKLEKFLDRCTTTRLCLSHEKCHMMMTEGLYWVITFQQLEFR